MLQEERRIAADYDVHTAAVATKHITQSHWLWSLGMLDNKPLQMPPTYPCSQCSLQTVSTGMPAAS